MERGLDPVRPRCPHLLMVGIAHAVFTIGIIEAVQAQGGSTGGSLGKTDHELSGTITKKAQPKKEPPPDSAKARVSSLSVSGNWNWQAKCANGSLWNGQFQLEHKADGTLSGMCHMSGAYGCGDVSGRVSGNSATFTVFWASPLGGHRNPFSFKIADGGRSMQGTEESVANGRCTYQARRS